MYHRKSIPDLDRTKNLTSAARVFASARGSMAGDKTKRDETFRGGVCVLRATKPRSFIVRKRARVVTPFD